MIRLCGVVRDRACWRSGLHHLDRPAASTWRQPKAHIHHAQEVSGERAARGVRRGDGLRQEEARPVRWEVGERLEHPLEEERRLFERDSLIPEVRQGIHENDETDRVGGEQPLQAFTQEGRELPTGERPRQVDAPEEAIRGDAAGLGHGDDRPDLKGQVPIDEGHSAPGGSDACGTAEGHPMQGGGSPHPDRARLWRDLRHRAQGQEVRPGRRGLLCRAVGHGMAIISTIC
jgi:hypothetical protein